MSFKKNIIPLLLAAATFLLVLPAFGQTKKGFKSLEKEKWDAAALAFVADTSDTALRPVALFGLASVLSNATNPKHDYVTAMRLQEAARQEWKALKTAQRTELTKKYNVTSGTIDKLKSATTTTAWKEMEKTATLRQADDFLEAFAGSRSPYLAKAVKKREDLLETAIYDAKTYADYAYLSHRHRDDIPLRFPTALPAIDHSAFDLFLQEKGVDWLGQFYEENPAHPLTRDEARNEFPETWNSNELTPMLDFLATRAKSGFAPYIRRKTVDLLKEQPLTDSLRTQLTPDQKSVIGEVELEAAGQLVDTDGEFDPQANDAWLNYVQKLAPSSRAYDALEKMTKHYLWKRDWAAASKSLHNGQSLFPDKKDWFEQLIALVDAPGTGIKAVNAGAIINDGGSEYIPVPTVDGKTLYFCATERPDNEAYEDVFMTTWQDSAWTKPKLVTELSGSGNQAPVSLTEGDARIILFNNGRPQQSDKTATGWTKPVPIDADMSQFSWVGLVQIAASGQVMLLEAINAVTTTDIDIYVCLRDEAGKWKKPVRVDNLCSTRRDRSPYLHPDMHTIYFSTDGQTGMGGMDVYYSTALDDTWMNWSKPINLGKEVNTLGDDWGYKISTDGQIAWFSTRIDSRSQDIFYVEVPKEMRPEVVKQAEFFLIDDQKKPLTNVEVVLESRKTGKKMGSFRPDPSTGRVVMPVPNDQEYTIHIEKEGYISKSEVIPVQKAGQPLFIKPDLRVLNLDKIAKSGQTLALNLLFDYDQAVLHDESLPELRRVAEQAKKGNLRLNVVGYTDNAGDPAYNLDLSKRRAEATKQALVKLGISADQITVDGFGEKNEVVPNDTEENRARNRRVEVQFINK